MAIGATSRRNFSIIARSLVPYLAASTLKQAYGKEIENLMRAQINHVTKPNFLTAFANAHKASMIRT
jgi:hypothetical protein